MYVDRLSAQRTKLSSFDQEIYEKKKVKQQFTTYCAESPDFVPIPLFFDLLNVLLLLLRSQETSQSNYVH